MNRPARSAAALLLAAFALAGCASLDGATAGRMAEAAGGVAVELTATPFHPQTTDQCGPAALATVLQASGVSATPATLRPLVYVPGRGGSLQPELLAATRRYDRLPYPLDGDPAGIIAELKAGRPVLVLQNLGLAAFPVWHYAVVVGYDPATRSFVLRSGDRKRRELPAGTFLKTWRRAGAWAFVALPPGELPAAARADTYLDAAADLEATGRFHAAGAAYRAAARRWPDNGWAWLGLGSVAWAEGDHRGAADAWQRAVGLDPGNVVALNNLAAAYAELGETDAALDVIETALARTTPGTPAHDAVLATREEIRGAADR